MLFHHINILELNFKVSIYKDGSKSKQNYCPSKISNYMVAIWYDTSYLTWYLSFNWCYSTSLYRFLWNISLIFYNK